MLRLSLVLLITFASGCADFIAPVNTRAQGCSSGADCLAEEACVLRGSSKICLRSAALNRCNRNGVLEGLESCDDGNSSNEDGCTNACQLARCGDGFLRRDLSPDDPEFEECEPGLSNDWVTNCRGNCRLGRRHGRLIAQNRAICALDDVASTQRLYCGVSGLDPYTEQQRVSHLFRMPISGLLAPGLATERSGWLLELSETLLATCSSDNCRQGLSLAVPLRALRDAVFEGKAGAIYPSDIVLDSGRVESVVAPGFCDAVVPALDRVTVRGGIPEEYRRLDFGRLPSGLPRRLVPESDVSNAFAVARSHRTACAVHADGTVSCWGDPAGWGEPESDCAYHAPQRLTDVSDVVEIEAEEESFIALRSDGGFYTWGRIPTYGRLHLIEDRAEAFGLNFSQTRTGPKKYTSWKECERQNQMPILHSRSVAVNQVSAAYCTHCVLEAGGSVWCKGLFDGSDELASSFTNRNFGNPTYWMSWLFDQRRPRGWLEMRLRDVAVELWRGLRSNTSLCVELDDRDVVCWGQSVVAEDAGGRAVDYEHEPLGTYRLRTPQRVQRFLDQ